MPGPAANLPLPVPAESPPRNSNFNAIRILYAFGGPENKAGGFEECAKEIANETGSEVIVEIFDLINGDHQDLANDTIFQKLIDRIQRKEFNAAMLPPPCSTFSSARSETDGGPRPLRKAEGPERYGRKDLTPEEKESVRLGTLLALRANAIAKAMREAGKPSITENPPEHEGKPSLFGLDEWRQFLDTPNVDSIITPQCEFGQNFQKMTALKGDRVDLSDAPKECTHERQWWRLPPPGRWIYAAHPPMTGKILAVKEHEWKAEMTIWRPRWSDPYLTRETAAYPMQFNPYLMKKPTEAARKTIAPKVENISNRTTPPSTMTRVGVWGNQLVRSSVTKPKPGAGHTANEEPRKLTFTTPLRGPVSDGKRRKVENNAALGGMRKPAKAVSSIPRLGALGGRIRVALDKFLEENPEIETACVNAIGSDDKNAGPNEEHIAKARAVFANILGSGKP